jgi:hypothetical protein
MNLKISTLMEVCDIHYIQLINPKVPITLIDKHEEVFNPQLSVSNIKNLGGNSPALDKQKFLAKLPKSVITNGKIIDVRNGIEELIEPTVDESVNIKTHIDPLAEHFNHHDNITAIQVKTEQGQKLILQLKFDDTIKMLRHYIDPYVKYARQL